MFFSRVIISIEEQTTLLQKTYTYVIILFRQRLHKHKEIKAFYPKSIIVIGRSKDFNDEEIKALRALNGRLSNIEVKTYDDLLSQAKNLLETIHGSTQNPNADKIDDELPF